MPYGSDLAFNDAGAEIVSLAQRSYGKNSVTGTKTGPFQKSSRPRRGARAFIVLQAFAALGHSSEPKLLDDPVITSIAKRVNRTPAQVLLAWAVQLGTALLTTSKTQPHQAEL